MKPTSRLALITAAALLVACSRAEAPAPPAVVSARVEVNGMQMYYEVSGSGDPLIVLHAPRLAPGRDARDAAHLRDHAAGSAPSPYRAVLERRETQGDVRAGKYAVVAILRASKGRSFAPAALRMTTRSLL